MNLKSVYREYLKRHPTCFLENNNIKFNQRLGALFTGYFMEHHDMFKEEIREVHLGHIFDLYDRKEFDYQRIINENLTFEEYLKIFLEIERKTNSGKQITYIII